MVRHTVGVRALKLRGVVHRLPVSWRGTRRARGALSHFASARRGLYVLDPHGGRDDVRDDFAVASPGSQNDVSPVARLELRTLRRDFGAIRAVKGLSLRIAPGEIHALCGHNGAGKSTVVKMLCGQLQPDAGELLIDGQPVHLHSPQAAQRSGIAHVDQELSVIPTLSVAENLMLGDSDEPLLLRRREIGRRSGELLGLVGLPAELAQMPLAQLSIGRRQLVEIARSLGRGAKVLLLDEPTATLSQTEIDLVYRAVRRVAEGGTSVIFVSHRLKEVIELCHRVTILRDGEAVATAPTEGLRPIDIAKLMLGDVPEQKASEPLGDLEPRLVAQNLEVPGLLGPVSLQFRPGQIYGLAGQVGSGASEVLRALAGLYPMARGQVTLDGKHVVLGRPMLSRRRGIVFVSSDRKGEGLFLGKDVQTNLLATRLKSVTRFGLVSNRRGRDLARTLAILAEVPVERLETGVDHLSGGNQQKVLVGRNLDDPLTKVILLDEPTRGVDIAGRSALHGILRQVAQRGATVVFSSTELDELVDLAHTVFTMREGHVIGQYEGNADPTTILSDITHAA